MQIIIKPVETFQVIVIACCKLKTDFIFTLAKLQIVEKLQFELYVLSQFCFKK